MYVSVHVWHDVLCVGNRECMEGCIDRWIIWFIKKSPAYVKYRSDCCHMRWVCFWDDNILSWFLLLEFQLYISKWKQMLGIERLDSFWYRQIPCFRTCLSSLVKNTCLIYFFIISNNLLVEEDGYMSLSCDHGCYVDEVWAVDKGGREISPGINRDGNCHSGRNLGTHPNSGNAITNAFQAINQVIHSELIVLSSELTLSAPVCTQNPNSYIWSAWILNSL